MILFKRPLLTVFIIIGAALIALSLRSLIDFNVPEEEVPAPKKIGTPQVTPPTSPPPGATEEEQQQQSPPPSSSGEDTSQEITRITVEGDEFSFSPANFTVKAGKTVELTFRNVGRAPHNLIVDELGLATKTIGGGKTDIVAFLAPDSAGSLTYTLYCSIPGHREAGMVGTITIE